VNYNNPGIGMAARAVLAKNGVETEVVYPACCGMPFLEQGNLPRVAEQADKVSRELIKWIDKGYDIITLTASCGLMLKFEWPLLLPEDNDIVRLSKATFDIDEYVVDIARKQGMAEGLRPIDGGASLHLACHARAQNMGAKGAELLRLIPGIKLDVIERCSGHGGTFGVMKKTRPSAMKIGKPAATTARQQGNAFVVSECPLAAKHLLQVMQGIDGEAKIPEHAHHPIELLARAYGLTP
jgi:glycerol-3-phosphate dehydrogenase subunit C